MNIAPFIADLLQEHDEVSVSGLGTFYKKRVEGYFDKQKNDFYPPSEKLAFKSDFRTDDLLTGYVGKQKNISLASAAYFVEKFAAGILQQLNDTGNADLSPLGVLFKSEAELTLEAEEKLKLGHSFYGFAPVKDIEKVPAASVGHYQEEIAPASDADNEYEFNDEPRKRSKGVLITGIITVILIVVTAIHFWKPELFKRLTEGAPAQVPQKMAIPVGKPQTYADSIAVADSIVGALEQQGFDVDSARDTIDVTTRAQQVNTTGTTYEIIAASLNRQADAERIVKAFKSKGIDARIILAKDKKRNNILVSLASFSDKPSAQKELTRIKEDIEPGAYIYDLKNQ
ncbi:MAG TPA: SPOR domain-containing protein [Sphingobacteriaceae bacterium]